MLRYIKCELSPTLVERVDVEQYISEKTNKPNVLRFWMNVISKITCMVVLNSMWIPLMNQQYLYIGTTFRPS
jgi:hypothetical protein